MPGTVQKVLNIITQFMVGESEDTRCISTVDNSVNGLTEVKTVSFKRFS